MKVSCRNIGCNHERNGFCTNAVPCGGADFIPESEQPSVTAVDSQAAGSIPHSAIDLIRTCTTFSIIETSNMDLSTVEDIVSSIKARADKASDDLLWNRCIHCKEQAEANATGDSSPKQPKEIDR